MTLSHPYDPRLTPARADLAAERLRGLVSAPRYVVGKRRTVVAGVADLRRLPRADAPLETQAIHGETLVLFDEDEGWGWVQLEGDGYVGYIALADLGPAPTPPTHRVAANRTFVYPGADMKRPVVAALPLGAQVAVTGVEGGFSCLLEGGFVFTAHLVSIDAPIVDFVAVAEQARYTPYLWGGKSPLGIDCSGLVQLCLLQSGVLAPRDTDLQQASIGEALPTSQSLDGLRRGDLVFWSGHVGIMGDAETLIHANAHHMCVANEPLRTAADRILANSGSPVLLIRRVHARAA